MPTDHCWCLHSLLFSPQVTNVSFFPYLTSRRQNPHTFKCSAVKTSIHMGECPKGLSQVYVGWWGESNLNGVLSSSGSTWHTRTHTHGKSYHLAPNVAYGPLQRMPLLQGGWNRSKWVEPPQGWGWGYCLSLQSSILFSQGSATDSWELKKLPQVENKIRKLLYFLTFIWTGKKPTGNRWEGQKVGL